MLNDTESVLQVPIEPAFKVRYTAPGRRSSTDFGEPQRTELLQCCSAHPSTHLENAVFGELQ